jgi:hypothetical protein
MAEARADCVRCQYCQPFMAAMAPKTAISTQEIRLP